MTKQDHVAASYEPNRGIRKKSYVAALLSGSGPVKGQGQCRPPLYSNGLRVFEISRYSSGARDNAAALLDGRVSQRTIRTRFIVRNSTMYH